MQLHEPAGIYRIPTDAVFINPTNHNSIVLYDSGENSHSRFMNRSYYSKWKEIAAEYSLVYNDEIMCRYISLLLRSYVTRLCFLFQY